MALALLAATGWIADNVQAATDGRPMYVNGWRVTEVSRSLIPPLQLLWDKSLTSFPERNRPGPHESNVRRLTNVGAGLVTLTNGTFYLLDRDTGKTLWSYPLKGEVDVTDWRANDEIVFFAAVDYSDSKSTIGLRGAIDFYSRKLLWLNRLADKQRYYGGGSAEWVLPIDDQRVLFSTEFSHVFFLGPLDILDARSGKTRVSFEKGFQYLEDVALSWFTKEGKLYVFLQPKTGGIELQPYDLNTGRRLATKRIIGDQRVGNNPFPVAIAGHETLVLPYKPNDKSQPTTLVGFSLSEERVAWQMSMPGTERTYSRYIEQLVRNGREPNLLVAMTEPNGIMLLNGQVGSIVKQGQLEGYVGWDSRQAVLYAHPYLYAGARRKTSNGMAYDLVALNIESGAVEWSYEIDKQSEISVSPRAELQNLIAVNDRVYVLTVDGRIMAFRARPW